MAASTDAAALTASLAAVYLVLATAARAPRPVTRRVAELRFGHPYAVVAVAMDESGPWHGVPVFSAWVTDPDEATAAEPGDATR